MKTIADEIAAFEDAGGMATRDGWTVKALRAQRDDLLAACESVRAILNAAVAKAKVE